MGFNSAFKGIIKREVIHYGLSRIEKHQRDKCTWFGNTWIAYVLAGVGSNYVTLVGFCMS